MQKRKIRWLIIILCGMVLAVSLYNLLPKLINYKKGQDIYKDVGDQAVKKKPGKDPDWWWKDIFIDFNYLQGINPEIKAWIRFDHLDRMPINYPVLYSGDNKKYLHHDIYGNYRYAGALFFDGNIHPPLSEKASMNDFIYGHLMKDGTMFAFLKRYITDSSTYKNNKYFTIYPKGKARRYKIFSYFETPQDSDVYLYGFSKGSKEYKQHLKYLERHSRVKGNASADQPIVTLSTCAAAGSSYRIVVTGKQVATHKTAVTREEFEKQKKK